MKNHPNLTIGIILAVSLGIGSIQGHRLDRMFEAQAFLRWMAAVATNERLGMEEEDSSTSYDDEAIYQEIVSATESELSGLVTESESENKISALSSVMEVGDHDREMYRLAKSNDLAPMREKFLDSLRDGRLKYTQDLSYSAIMSGLEGEGSVSIFNIFFGFRKVAANFVWLQVDRYWHSGLLHRMIPLMKTCVLLDPNFIDAYLLGAWHLGYNVTAGIEYTPYPLRVWSDKQQECLGDQEVYYYIAVDFLKDGIRNNPRNYKLYFDLGYALYREKLNDTENAVKYLESAVRLPHERWVPRMLNISLQEDGQYERALEGWQKYLERFPEHDVSLRFVDRLEGLIAERKAQEAKEQARATEDPVEREMFMSEYRRYTAEAYTIWENMEEVYADARKMRLDAIAMAEKGYYLEAFTLLDKARFEAGSLFEEFSDLIIEIKLAGDIPLSLSEIKQRVREEEGVTCQGMPEAVRIQRADELNASRKPIL